MTKTPFELRAEILKMATDYLTQQYQNGLEHYNLMLEAATKIGQVSIDEMSKYLPKYPTSDEILAQAAKFYDFVGKAK